MAGRCWTAGVAGWRGSGCKFGWRGRRVMVYGRLDEAYSGEWCRDGTKRSKKHVGLQQRVRRGGKRRAWLGCRASDDRAGFSVLCREWSAGSANGGLSTVRGQGNVVAAETVEGTNTRRGNEHLSREHPSRERTPVEGTNTRRGNTALGRKATPDTQGKQRLNPSRHIFGTVRPVPLTTKRRCPLSQLKLSKPIPYIS